MWLSFNLNRLHRQNLKEELYFTDREQRKIVRQKCIKQYPELYILAVILAQSCLRGVIGLPAEQSELLEGMYANKVWPEVLSPNWLSSDVYEFIYIVSYMFCPECPTLYNCDRIYINFKMGILSRKTYTVLFYPVQGECLHPWAAEECYLLHTFSLGLMMYIPPKISSYFQKERLATQWFLWDVVQTLWEWYFKAYISWLNSFTIKLIQAALYFSLHMFLNKFSGTDMC